MMEPVAWMDDGTTRTGSETTGFRVVHADTKATMPRASSDNFTVPLVRLSDAEARIAELIRNYDDAYNRGLIDGNRLSVEQQQAIHAAEARAEAAEARIKELEAKLAQADALIEAQQHDFAQNNIRNAENAHRAEAAEALLKEAREALKASGKLIDRMMHVHVAPDECTSYVEPSRRWFLENGGSLAAIADQQAMNRRALREKP